MSETYSENMREALVDDGLCWSAISKEMPDANNRNWPESLWTDSKRRVVFLVKESNRNEGEDYKDWDWSEGSKPFGNVLAYWLEGILTTTSDNNVTYQDLPWRKEIFKKRPVAIVNLKKLAGDSSADWSEIREYAERDQEFLRKQIREILRGNIIVCGGSNDAGDSYRKILTIALDFIYPDIKEGFRQVNDWCHYNAQADILLIDSYHPSYRGMAEECKVDGLLGAFHDFLRATPGYPN